MSQKKEEMPQEDKFRLDDIEVKRRQSEYKKYALPTKWAQLKYVVMLEFKQYFKSKGMIILYILALIIPVLQMVGVDVIGMISMMSSLMSGGSELTSLQYMHYMLLLIPTVMVLAMAILCGRTISQEFDSRTCFLNLPLPVDRWIFFSGKYIASAITSFSVLLIGYGFAAIATNAKYGQIAIDPLINSLILSVFVMLAMISTGMFFSGILKKRAGLVSLSLMMFIIPLIPLAILLVVNMTTVPSWMDIFLYTPPFLTDEMLILLGWDPTMSLSGFAIGTFYNRVADLVPSIIAAFLWAAAFFAAGGYLFRRREV